MSVTEDLTTGSDKEQADRSSRNKVLYAAGGLVAFLVTLAVLSHLPGDAGQIAGAMLRVAIQPQTAAVVIAVIGLNIHFGYTGLLNMGQAGFMMLGAYGFAISIWKGAADGGRRPGRLRGGVRLRAHARHPDAEAAR